MIVGPTGHALRRLFVLVRPATAGDAPVRAAVHALPAWGLSERLNPSLYENGKVCLSLLGTWSGPGWDPESSTLLQLLVSVQSLVLVDKPYYNEPGHERHADTVEGEQQARLYNENAGCYPDKRRRRRAGRPPRPFRGVVAAHFARVGPALLGGRRRRAAATRTRRLPARAAAARAAVRRSRETRLEAALMVNWTRLRMHGAYTKFEREDCQVAY